MFPNNCGEVNYFLFRVLLLILIVITSFAKIPPLISVAIIDKIQKTKLFVSDKTINPTITAGKIIKNGLIIFFIIFLGY